MCVCVCVWADRCLSDCPLCRRGLVSSIEVHSLAYRFSLVPAPPRRLRFSSSEAAQMEVGEAGTKKKEKRGSCGGGN